MEWVDLLVESNAMLRISGTGFGQFWDLGSFGIWAVLGFGQFWDLGSFGIWLILWLHAMLRCGHEMY